MALVRERATADPERKILMQSIVDTTFLAKLRPSISLKYFKSTYSKTIMKWILEYYDQYQQAPGRLIQDIYLDNKDQLDEEDDVKLISTLLSSISNEWASSNPVYDVDVAVRYMKKRGMETLMEAMQERLEIGDVKEAEDLLSDYHKPDVQQVQGIWTMDDDQFVHNSFNLETQVLFTPSGAVGEMIGSISRQDFVAFMAYMKKGKSYGLDHMKEEALMAGLNVQTFNLEMSESQYGRRQWQSFSGRPLFTTEAEVPKFTPSGDQAKPWKIEYYTERREGFPRDPGPDFERIKRQVRWYVRGKHKLTTLPSKTTTVADIDRILRDEARETGFVPDVLIVDYADLLKSTKPKDQTRDQLDEIWSSLRKLAQVWNIAVITATQSTRAGASQDVASDQVAEDIRKVAHVTRLIGINRSNTDKRNSVVRLQLLETRESFFTPIFDEVLCLSCLTFGRFILDSRFLKDVIYEKEKVTKKLYG